MIVKKKKKKKAAKTTLELKARPEYKTKTHIYVSSTNSNNNNKTQIRWRHTSYSPPPPKKQHNPGKPNKPVLMLQIQILQTNIRLHSHISERHQWHWGVSGVINSHMVWHHARVSVLEAVPGSGNGWGWRLCMSVAVVTRSKDDSRERGSDVNHEAIRHSCRL